LIARADAVMSALSEQMQIEQRLGDESLCFSVKRKPHSRAYDSTGAMTPSSAGVFDNPVLDFGPEALLVPFVVFGGFEVEWIVEIAEIEKER